MKLASEAPFPYGWPGRVLYIEQDIHGALIQLRTRPEMRGAVDRACGDESQILAAWPGQHRTDLFLIDKPDLLAAAIGLGVSVA